MGQIDVNTMKEFDEKQKNKAKQLRALTRTPFDVNQKEQLIALKQHIDSFEYTLNQMYLYRAMNSLGSVGTLAFFLPLPLMGWVSTYSLYLALGSFFLERFSMSEFNHQLNDMKSIYNWVLKHGKKEYNGDSSLLLEHQDIQRMIRLMAPLCDVSFIKVWPSVLDNKPKEQANYLGSLGNSLFGAGKSTFNLFNTPHDSPNIDELKRKVETQAFKLGVIDGFKQSIHYFKDSAVHFMNNDKERARILSTLLNHTIGEIKQLITPLFISHNPIYAKKD